MHKYICKVVNTKKCSLISTLSKPYTYIIFLPYFPYFWPSQLYFLQKWSKTSLFTMVYPHSLRKRVKNPKKEKGPENYHGSPPWVKKTWDHTINTLWRTLPKHLFSIPEVTQTFFPIFICGYVVTIFVSGNHILPFHHSCFHTIPTMYVAILFVPILDPFPVWQLSVETTREPTRGAAEPLPRTATVSHSTGKGVFLFICISLVWPIYVEKC